MVQLRYNQISKARATEVIAEFFATGNALFEFSVIQAFHACAKILTASSKTEKNINEKAAIDFLSCYVELRRLLASHISYDKIIHQVVYTLDYVPNYRLLKGNSLVENGLQTSTAFIANFQASAQTPVTNPGAIITATINKTVNDNLRRPNIRDQLSAANSWRSPCNTSPTTINRLTHTTMPEWQRRTKNNDAQSNKNNNEETICPGRRRYEPTRNYRSVDNQASIQPANAERDACKSWRRSEKKVEQVIEVKEVSRSKEASESEKQISIPLKSTDQSKETSQIRELDQPRAVDRLENDNQHKKIIDAAKNDTQETSKRRRRGGRKQRNETANPKTKPKPFDPGTIFLLPRVKTTYLDGKIIEELSPIACRMPDPKEPAYEGVSFKNPPHPSRLPMPSSFKKRFPYLASKIDESSEESKKTPEPGTLMIDEKDENAKSTVEPASPKSEDSGYHSNEATKPSLVSDESNNATYSQDDYRKEDEALHLLRQKVWDAAIALDTLDYWTAERLAELDCELKKRNKEGLEMVFAWIVEQRYQQTLSETRVS